MMRHVVERLPRVGDAQEYWLSDGSFRSLSAAFLARTDIDLDDFAAVGRVMGLERKTMAEENLKNFRDFQDQMAEINKAALEPNAFDLDRCMKDGGKCLAGDASARVICTDAKGDWPLVVLIEYAALGQDEVVRWFGRNGTGKGNLPDLRNLPEYKEVEVTLWETSDGNLGVGISGGQHTGPPGSYRPYGPPVKVRFER